MIRIIAKEEGFRRCGVAHSTTATDHPDGRFTPNQLKILVNEPMLKVQQLDNPGSDGPGDRPNATATIALVQAAQTLEELNKLAEGEDRKGVQTAIAKRRAELTPKPDDQSDQSDQSEEAKEVEEAKKEETV